MTPSDEKVLLHILSLAIALAIFGYGLYWLLAD